MPTPTYTLIASSTVGSGGAANITFSSIPGTYTDLKIVVSVRHNSSIYSTSADLAILFNGSSSSFTTRYLQGNGSSASSGSGTNNLAGIDQGSGYTANTFASNDIYIPNYTSSNNKSYSVDGVSENNATAAISGLYAGLWSNTSAITSITIQDFYGQNLVQYSTAYLYGIKKD
jgi:hypothetical protein